MGQRQFQSTQNGTSARNSCFVTTKNEGSICFGKRGQRFPARCQPTDPEHSKEPLFSANLYARVADRIILEEKLELAPRAIPLGANHDT